MVAALRAGAGIEILSIERVGFSRNASSVCAIPSPVAKFVRTSTNSLSTPEPVEVLTNFSTRSSSSPLRLFASSPLRLFARSEVRENFDDLALDSRSSRSSHELLYPILPALAKFARTSTKGPPTSATIEIAYGDPASSILTDFTWLRAD